MELNQTYSDRHLRRIIKRKTAQNLRNLQGSSKLLPSVATDVCPSKREPFTDAGSLEVSSIPDVSDTSTLNASEDSDTQLNVESSEDDHLGENVTVDLELAQWAVQHKIPHCAVSDLLTILRKYEPFNSLPKDSRTLLNTPKSTAVRNVTPGVYTHFGFEEGLVRILNGLQLVPNELSVQINIDGLPISKSSSAQFWPILGSVAEVKSSVFTIGLYFGDKKPEKVAEFLEEFVSEGIVLLGNGLKYKNKRIRVKVNSFICDAPARAYVKSIKGHTGFHGCGKCNTDGEYYERRVVFPELSSALRTDESFRAKSDEEHHTGDTILQKLPVNLIDQFPYEYMHLVCLGVVRKLIKLWLRGDFRVFRLPSQEVEQLSNKLQNLSDCICCEFARKPRSLRELDRWKATEFRQFLLYTGPVVLQNSLPSEHYNLFMCLHCAISILANKDTCLVLNNYAKDLLTYFVQTFGSLYGRKHISYNVHGLIHLSGDVKTLGPLDTFSGFKFENHLGFIKKLLKKPNNPLQQIHRRLSEFQSVQNVVLTTSIQSAVYTRAHSRGPTAQKACDRQYTVVSFNDYTIKVDEANCTCILSDRSIIKVYNIVTRNNVGFFIAKPFSALKPLFTSPCDSTLLNIYSATIPNSHVQFKEYPIKSMARKCVMLPINSSEAAVFPLLHSDKSE
jgi:hypothetical protein